jgi:hypothetical protein
MSTIRHHRLLAIVASVVAASTAACGGSDATTSSLAGEERPTLVTPAPATDIAAGVCIDATPSIDPAVPELARMTLAARVASWVPPPTSPTELTPAVPGLDLLVRKVTTDSDSLSLVGQVARVKIAAVPGVSSEPGPSINFSELMDQHQKQATDAQTARDAATKAAAAGTDTITNADLTSAESEIRGCVEALAWSMPRSTLLLVSDLEQDGNPQVGIASLKDVRLIVVHSCRLAGPCVEQEAAWTNMFAEAGGAAPMFLTVENMEKGFDQLLSAPVR